MAIPEGFDHLNLTREKMRAAAQHLATSDRGRDALRHVLAWLEKSGLSLDHQNQECVIVLLEGAWGAYSGTVREVMHEALGDR